MAVLLHAHGAQYITTIRMRLCLKACCDTNVVLCSAGPYGAEVVWCADHIVIKINNLLGLVVIDARMNDQQTNRNALPRNVLCFRQLIQRKRWFFAVVRREISHLWLITDTMEAWHTHARELLSDLKEVCCVCVCVCNSLCTVSVLNCVRINFIVFGIVNKLKKYVQHTKQMCLFYLIWIVPGIQGQCSERWP